MASGQASAAICSSSQTQARTMRSPRLQAIFIVSIAADFAWSARRFLRAQGLPDDLSVSARWRTLENPSSLGDIHVTVTVPRAVGAMSDPLIDALDERVAALSLDEPLHLEICAP
jgi:hypothetical protein